MELSKIQIAKLEEHNWAQWKFRMVALLRDMDGLLDIVEGKVQRPVRPTVGAGDAAAVDMAAYADSLRNLIKHESIALLLITNNISDENLDKVIRFSTPKEIWDELHRLYEGVNDNRVYDFCMQFFKYRMDATDDMATHISKIKNLWSNLKNELNKEGHISELPEIYVSLNFIFKL